MHRRIIASSAALAAFFALGIGAAAELAGNEKEACASATASTPEHVLGVDTGPVYTIPGDVAEATSCVTVTADTVTGPTTTVVQTVTETLPATTTTPPPTTTAPPPPPPRHVLWGSSTPPRAAHGTTSREAEARFMEAKIGRKYDVTRHYVKATTPWTGDGAQTTVDNGRIPVVSFTSGGDTWAQVAAGSLDAYVTNQTKALKARGGLWNKAYIGFENEPENEGGKGGPNAYVAAYQHIIAVENAAGMPASVHKTTFLQEFSWQTGSGRTPEAWIPKGIDTLGIHGYGTRVGSCGKGARTFFDLFDAPYASAVKFNLRMGIFEMGFATEAGTSPDIKANFFRSIPGTLTTKFPRIDAITYWNQNGSCAVANSYYIDSSPTALQGYTDAGHTAILGGP